MPLPSLFDPIYMIVKDDIQTVARHHLHRNLTADELHVASYAFAHHMDWWDAAVRAVDLAVSTRR